MQIMYELESYAPSGPTWARTRGKQTESATPLTYKLHSTEQPWIERNCLPSKIEKAQETHWCNRKLEKLRKETRERFRRAKKGNTDELWNLSNATRDAYRKEIREAKGKRWTSICSDIEKGAEAARLNRLMARNPGAMLSTLRLPNGTYSESDEETLSLLTTAHFPSFKGPTEVGGYFQKDRPLPATQLGIHRQLAYVRWPPQPE